MASVVRNRLLGRVFGGGIDGMVALAVVDALMERVRASRNDGDVLIRARLEPGGTYLVTTRPAPDRKERRLLSARAAAEAKLTRAERPTRRRGRAARRNREAAVLRERIAELDAAIEARRSRQIARAKRRQRRAR
jgi:hypothetical protein